MTKNNYNHKSQAMDSISKSYSELDSYDYVTSKNTNRINIRFECAGWECGTLPEMLAVKRKHNIKEPIIMITNGERIAL